MPPPSPRPSVRSCTTSPMTSSVSRSPASRRSSRHVRKAADDTGWPGCASRRKERRFTAFAATIERLGHVRSIGIEAARATRVPRHHLLRLIREAERLPASDLRDLATVRRRGILVALALELVPRLTDEALDLHDRLVGRMFRRAERRQLAALGDDRRSIGRTIRLFARVGDELARGQGRGSRRVRRHRGRGRLGAVRGRGRGGEGACRSARRGSGRASRGELRAPPALHAAPARDLHLSWRPGGPPAA